VTDRDPIQITEAELRELTVEMEDSHADAIPRMYEAVAEWAHFRKEAAVESLHDLGSFSASRRGFLAGACLALGGVVLAACGSSSSKGSSSSTTRAAASGSGSSSNGTKLTGDLAVAALATALENLAVATYQGGIDAATAGKLWLSLVLVVLALEVSFNGLRVVNQL